MVFASLIFLFLFLPLNLLLYYSTKNATWRNLILIVFSLFFYGWGEPIWITLMIFSATVDYVNGRVIEKYRGKIGAKIGLISSLIINLGLLATFKYSSFIVENVNGIFGTSFSMPHFALPIGISFYTFQTISYSVDVYRNEVKAQRSYLKFLMFVSLFHQLVAGPIVRYSHIASEIDNRKEKLADISMGISRFCIGLFKKVVIANVAAELVRKYMGDNSAPLTMDALHDLSTGAAWFGLVMFALQIYFDFSGYSDMAIGLGWMFGFHYHENFKYPYTATSITDFWRRWHISLGTFFKDYVYIPMGGNKKRIYFNLFVVWFLTGMWHGASWNFIFWGLYFFVFISLEKAFILNFLKKIPKFFSHVYALLIIIPGWVIFYFTDTKMLGAYVGKLFSFGSGPLWDMEVNSDLTANLFWFIFAIICCMPVYHKVKHWFDNRLQKPALFEMAAIGVNVICIFLCVAQLVGKSYNPFIYFRF
ncbi:MAG TPA: MBOAT family O-acyltransferase [Chitinophagaceae bacterium]|nr:MBOAT family protein [Chitinophagales bacterium]HPG10097.1 MBOAT family O-acyltransferase [Chitinophagaceae bacterium]HRX93035.1 MBOAT family O-acyltransferase [Chitinophagaceae bacterium]